VDEKPNNRVQLPRSRDLNPTTDVHRQSSIRSTNTPESDLLNGTTDPRAPIDPRNVVDMETFRNYAAQTNANMAQMRTWLKYFHECI